jgi:hypothetical protein
MTEQLYHPSGDSIVTDKPGGGGGWWLCEHTDDSVTHLEWSPGDGRVTCPDCATVYVVWHYGGHRLAKPVVVRVT